MGTLCIVPCSNRKIWDRNPDIGPVEAKKAYTGILTRYAIKYAEEFCDKWVILSAKHGLLLPNDKVPGPYDVTFSRKNDKAISLDDLRRQAAEKKLYSYEKVVVLGGKSYAEVARNIFGKEKVEEPLRRLGYGEKVSALKRALEERRPLH